MTDRRRAFTLLEIMIALGIMAIGLSAALALFTAAASTGRRAEALVQSAHIADLAFAEAEARLTLGFDHESLPEMSPEQAMQMNPESAAAALEAEVFEAAPETSEGGAGGPWLVREGVAMPGYEGFEVWTLLSPLEGQTEPPTAFLCEVFVNWSLRGRRRGAQYQTVLLRKLTRADLPEPP